jgi:hypothetical protein
MRTVNYVFSAISILLGVALVGFMLTQRGWPAEPAELLPWRWHIGTAIGALLIINGVVRLWFAQDD